MSDPSKPPIDSRPAPRVFRPFTGRQAGEGSPAPAAPMGRRPPAAPRPFFGRSSQESQPVVQPAAVVAVAPPTTEIAPPPVAPPPVAPTTTPEQEAWKSYLGLPSRVEDTAAQTLTPQATQEPERQSPAWESVANAPAIESPSEQPITVEVPAYDDEPATLAFEQPDVAPTRQRVVTRELVALPEEELSETAAEQPTLEAEPDVLDAPRFVAPASELPADSLIDEVDAAFISSGLPSLDPSSDAAKYAAATLEAIAQRLRSGQIELRNGAATTSEESVLATVLAALLANR